LQNTLAVKMPKITKIRLRVTKL